MHIYEKTIDNKMVQLYECSSQKNQEEQRYKFKGNYMYVCDQMCWILIIWPDFTDFPALITLMPYHFTKTYVTLTTLVPPGQNYPFLQSGRT